MLITNKYLVYWDTETKEIQNKYDEPIEPGTAYDFASTVTVYASDSLSDIVMKIDELGLIRPTEDSII